MAKLPTISVNIPLITNGSASVVLKSLKNIDYPKKLFEIIIVEGKQIAKQRNEAIKHSSGEILYLLDNDSRVQPNCLGILAKEFSKQNVAAVGGPSLTDKGNSTYFNELVTLTLETYFGAMRMRFRYSSKSDEKGSEFRLIGANLALRKSAVVKVGKFNEKIVPNEETELLRRLKLAGHNLRYNNKLFIYRDHRKNIYHLAKQFHHYGKGRMKQIQHSFNIGYLIFILPIGFLLYLISLFVIRPLWYFIPLLIYFSIGIATSFKASFKYKRPDLLLAMLTIFPVIHLSYAYGLLNEYFSLPKEKQIQESISNVKVIKFK